MRKVSKDNFLMMLSDTPYGVGAYDESNGAYKIYTHKYMMSGSGTTRGKQGLLKFLESHPQATLHSEEGWGKILELDVQLFKEKGWLVAKDFNK